MAEKIIQDLRNTGNESLDSLINMLNSYQTKYNQVKAEIEKLKQLIMLKDDEILQLDEDIAELSVKYYQVLLSYFIVFCLDCKGKVRGEN